MEPMSKDHSPHRTWADRYGDAIFLSVTLLLIVVLLVLRVSR